VGVTFDEDELWNFLEDTHTGILTTLRADGWPLALPVWFVTADHRIYVRTPARTRKVAHVGRDPRVCFTAEAGVSWGELRAVVLTGHAHVLPDGDERDRVFGLISQKYKGFGIPVDEVPAATKECARGHGPLEVEMGVVLPGEADAAEDLHAGFRATGKTPE
jgi:PPOX class probable F420-dependent enzyme